MSTSESLTLKQIQAKLNVRQHVLIHLCEKGVIEPDIQETEGRGLHREFSKRNLFEFALALAIRRYEIPVMTTAAIIKLLRLFERSTERKLKGFNLLTYLNAKEKKVDLSMRLYEGSYLVFAFNLGLRNVSWIGFDLMKAIISKNKEMPKVDYLDELPKDFDSYLHFDLNFIAKKIYL